MIPFSLVSPPFPFFFGIRSIYTLIDQTTLLLHAPILLNSLLNIVLAHNWLTTAMRVMRLHGFIVQGMTPDSDNVLQFLGTTEDPTTFPDSVEGLVDYLESKGDPRVNDLKEIGESWPRLKLVDAKYKGTRG